METPWGNETQHFFTLTPDLILRAVESAGYRCTGRSFTLYSMENRVYSVEIETEDTSNRWAGYRIVKFYRPGRWSREQILEEHQFLADLIADEVPVVPVLPVGKGSTLGVEPETGLFFAIYPRIGGRIPDEIAPNDLPIVARLLARLHATGRSIPTKHRIQLTPETYGQRNLQYLLGANIIPREFEQQYADLVGELVVKTTPWFAAASYQRIHGDCHRANLLWGNDGPFWLDFDDMVMGPAVQDMWLLIHGIEKPGHIRDTFLDAYEEFASFDYATLKLIEPLRALRYIHFAAWIAKRWEDPTFPNAFPQFGQRSYWQGQIDDLREQLEKLG